MRKVFQGPTRLVTVVGIHSRIQAPLHRLHITKLRGNEQDLHADTCLNQRGTAATNLASQAHVLPHHWVAFITQTLLTFIETSGSVVQLSSLLPNQEQQR
jgi:hypothetical protein